MNPLALASTLRKNHNEVIQRWLVSLHGRVSEDYEQMLGTQMGQAVADSLLRLAAGFLNAEEYEKEAHLEQVYRAARDVSYRRAAVGFSLTDTIISTQALREVLQETLFNHITTSSAQEESDLLDALFALNHLSDSLVTGEIAGYLAFLEQGEDEGYNLMYKI